MQKRIIIIGAGFSGLSAAALLAKHGYKVTVLEKNKIPGGRAMIHQDKGFTFDMGPSWYLMPEIFDRYFGYFGKKTSDYYSLKRLDPGYRIFFGNNDLVDISASIYNNLKLFDDIEKDGGKKLLKYLKISEFQYKTSIDKFIYKEYESILDFFDKKLLLEGAKLHLFENMEQYLNRFFKEDRAKKILQYNLVFLGGAPKNTPALYALMGHIDFNLGVWYPENGGMNQVVKALTELCKSYKVKIIYNSEVKKFNINTQKKSIYSVNTSDSTYESDIILSSGDYNFVETKLLPNKFQTYNKKYWNKKILAPSAFVMYIGLSKKIKGIKHHNLFLDNNWIDHFNEIFENPSWPDHPSYYLCCPSKTDSTVAPKDCENLFFLVPIAPGLPDTPKIRLKYSQKILDHFENLIDEAIQENIITKRILTIKDYENLYHAFKGSALGLSHTLFQTALFRPSHKSKKISNLYYTGQYTHPGIGVPMALISSELAVKKIIKDND